MRVATTELADFLEEEYEGDLRSIAEYSKEGYEMVYIRPDIEAQYDDDVHEALEFARLDALSTDLQEGLYRHGRLDCVIYHFEHAVELNMAFDMYDGVVVGLERGVFDDTSRLVDICTDIARPAL